MVSVGVGGMLCCCEEGVFAPLHVSFWEGRVKTSRYETLIINNVGPFGKLLKKRLFW